MILRIFVLLAALLIIPSLGLSSSEKPITGYSSGEINWTLGNSIDSTDLAQFGLHEISMADTVAYTNSLHTIQFDKKDTPASISLIFRKNRLSAIGLQVHSRYKSTSALFSYYQSRYPNKMKVDSSNNQISYTDDDGNLLIITNCNTQSLTQILYIDASFADLQGDLLSLLEEENILINISESPISRRSSCWSRIAETYDDMEDITWFKHVSSPSYTYSSQIYAYFGHYPDNQISLRLKIDYIADDWLFIDKYIIKADDKRYHIPINKFAVNRDIRVGGILESSDLYADQLIIDALEAISKAQIVKLRYSGDVQYFERILSQGEIDRLNDVYWAFIEYSKKQGKPHRVNNSELVLSI